MSLRWRFTLISTLILALFIAIFGVLAVFSMRFFMIQRVDQSLDQQATALVRYILLQQVTDLRTVKNSNTVSPVFFVLFDRQGDILSADADLPITPAYLDRVAGGETIHVTEPLPSGGNLRTLLEPIPDPHTGLNPSLGVLQASTPLTFIDDIINETTFLLAIASLTLLAVGAVGAHLLTGRVFRTVGTLTRKVHQIELSQDLSQRLPETNGEDEVGNLIKTFNGLLTRLEASFDTQRRFVADSSHELRTPLTVIKSNIHLLRQTSDPDERAELLKVTDGEVSRLNRMIDDLLYMAQMQAGHDLKPVLRPVELDSLILDVYARARPLALRKNQKLSLIHEDIAGPMGDREQLQHLLLNLLDNAIKYTGEGGAITLGLWTDRGWARIEVSDNGPGIEEQDLPHVFDRFYRTSTARQNQRNGSGLGLAIVKSIAEAHGGKIEVYSRLGEGTTFRLWLRLVDSAPLPDVDDEYDAPADLKATELVTSEQSGVTGRET
jgi:two-component system OmpR family sensor kinase